MNVKELEDVIKVEKAKLVTLETLYESTEDENKQTKLEYKISRLDERIEKLVDRQEILLDKEEKDVEDGNGDKDADDEVDDTVCPVCGSDLEETEEDGVYRCVKCNEFWETE